MGKSIPSLLKIQGWWKVTNIKEEKHTIHLYLLQMRKTAVCPCCLKRTKTGYDRQPERVLLHTILGDQLLYLHIVPRRFICRCNPTHPFIEKLSGITGKRRTTTRFDGELLEHLSGQSFKTVERKLAVSYPAARARLETAVDPTHLRWKELSFLSEIHLGLDGHHLVNKRFVETIAEVKEHIPLGILPTTRKTVVLAGLMSCPQELKARVKSINVDMDNGIINAAKTVFPDAAIVIDHFHVISDANQRLNMARRIEEDIINQERAKKGLGKIEIPIQLMRLAKEHLGLKRNEPQQLEELLEQYPRLKIWYVSKERLRAVYKAKTKEEGTQLLESLILSLRTSDDIELALWGKTLRYYQEEILNYFLYRTTNAYTEGLHVRCKLVQRLSCGFRNAEVYIRKALLTLLPLSVIVSEKLHPQYLS